MDEFTMPVEGMAQSTTQAAAVASMDEDAFRLFYSVTARRLWAYLARVSGDPALADDLLQEAYLRFLQASQPGSMEEAHRRNYLFRIATNLLRDHFRQSGRQLALMPEVAASGGQAEQACLRQDLAGALNELNPRERQLLWLAYAEGASHAEIAEQAGFKTNSIRPLLSRARQKLAALLRQRGFGPPLRKGGDR